jgi:hypothetical protein
MGHISPFWSLTFKIILYMSINMKYLVGSGVKILFWFDVRYVEVSFYILFLNLFAKAKSPIKIIVA